MAFKQSNKKQTQLKTLDLHAYKKDEVFDAIDKFLTKHINQAKVKIMTGKGKGIVQAETLRYLKLANYNWEYELINGQKNTGVIVVFVS